MIRIESAAAAVLGWLGAFLLTGIAIAPLRRFLSAPSTWGLLIVPSLLGVGVAFLAATTPFERQSLFDRLEDVVSDRRNRVVALTLVAYLVIWPSAYYLVKGPADLTERDWNIFWLGLGVPPFLTMLVYFGRRWINDAG